MRKHKVIGLLLLAAVVSAACGGGPSNATPTPAATALPPLKANAASGTTGKLEPARYANLSFATGGEVAAVLVKEGDAVKANDVIARLRTDAQEAAIARAEAGVADAKANEARYQEQLPQQIAAAEAEVQAAQAQIATVSARQDDPAAIAAAEAALAQAKVSEKAAKDAYQKVLDQKRYGPTEEQARIVLESAQRETQSAQLRLDQLTSGALNDRANRADLAAAEARLQAAQTNLDELNAEANGKPNPTYAAAVRQAEAVLNSARLRRGEAELRAPFAGTIAQLPVQVGETIGPGSPVGMLADFSGWLVETDDLTEVKVPSIQIGQKVTIQLDALPDAELKGVVQSIGQLYQEKSGEVVYPVKISLIDAQADPRLRWGMTAKVNFDQ